MPPPSPGGYWQTLVSLLWQSVHLPCTTPSTWVMAFVIRAPVLVPFAFRDRLEPVLDHEPQVAVRVERV